MPASLDPQLALDEKAVNDPDLEAALERHLRARDDVAEARGVAKTYRQEVDAALAKHELEPDSALRVGRFRITKRHVEGEHREFDTAPRDQISIGLVDADGKPARRGKAERAEKGSSGSDGDDFDDLRPKGEVNADALRGEAERSSLPEPTPFRPGGRNAARNASRAARPPIQ